MQELLKFYAPDGPERAGFVLNDGTIVEVQNADPDPENACTIAPEDFITFEDCATATWHTHPGASSNLSVDDMFAFKNWPDLKHYVVGIDGVRCFRVERGKVLNDS